MTEPDLTPQLRDQFVEHLITDGGDDHLAAHIRAGGTTRTYIDEWLTARSAAARARQITPETAQRILDLPAEREGQGSTIRTYLTDLLAAFWNGNATPHMGMHGSSDWKYDIYEALLAAGLIGVWRDGYGVGYRPDGTKHSEDEQAADRLVTAAIRALGHT